MSDKKSPDKTHADTLLPKPFIRKSDIPQGESVALTIIGTDVQEFYDRKLRTKVPRGIVRFKGTSKYLILNEARHTQIKDLLGDYIEDWIGKRISLFIDPTVMVQGKPTEGLRVKKAPPLQTSPQDDADEEDDF